jgi:predicted N-acyltransferase
MEGSRIGYRPRYLLVEDERGPRIGIVADTSPSVGRSRWMNVLVRRLALAVGAPFSSRHCGIMMRQDTRIDEVDQMLTTLCRHERRPLVTVANLDGERLSEWSARRFHARPQPARMALDLSVPSYDEYLKCLTSRQRHELRRVHRRASEADVSIRQVPLHAEQKDLYPLLEEVSGRHRSRLFSQELFPALVRELPGQAIVHSGSIGEQLAGFFLCLRQGDALLVILAGLRYALAQPTSLYFVLIDELIRWSLGEGIQHIHAGLSNEAQKLRHGFQPHARWLCMRASPDPLNSLIARAI